MTRLRLLSFLGRAAAPHYRAVGAHLAGALGIELEELREPRLCDLPAELRGGPALLFLCGLPYVRSRDAGADLEALAAPVPPGGDEPVYGSALVVRTGAPAAPEAALALPRIGFNGRDSLSGWVLPRHGIVARQLDPDAVRWQETGSHARSLRLLADGEIDAAPIDTMVLALERRLAPDVAALRVAAVLGEAPSPPVCALGVERALGAAVREALARLPEGAPELELGGIRRFAAVDDARYDEVRRLDALGRPGASGEER